MKRYTNDGTNGYIPYIYDVENVISTLWEKVFLVRQRKRTRNRNCSYYEEGRNFSLFYLFSSSLPAVKVDRHEFRRLNDSIASRTNDSTSGEDLPELEIYEWDSVIGNEERR